MSHYIKIIWINITEEWDFPNQLMGSELQISSTKCTFNKNGLPFPSETLQF